MKKEPENECGARFPPPPSRRLPGPIHELRKTRKRRKGMWLIGRGIRREGDGCSDGHSARSFDSPISLPMRPFASFAYSVVNDPHYPKAYAIWNRTLSFIKEIIAVQDVSREDAKECRKGEGMRLRGTGNGDSGIRGLPLRDHSQGGLRPPRHSLRSRSGWQPKRLACTSTCTSAVGIPSFPLLVHVLVHADLPSSSLHLLRKTHRTHGFRL